MLWFVLAFLLKLTVLGAVGENDFAEEFEKLRKECFHDPKNRLMGRTPGKTTCSVQFHGTCWPETPANMTIYLKCPSIFFDHLYGNISRRCNESGEWGNIDISFCKKYSDQMPDEDKGSIKLRIYVILSWFSVSIMVPSLIVTACFLKGNNERFNVHASLILAFTCRITTFFIHHYANFDSPESSRISCNLVWILNRYFASTEIMWMLNEALLLLRKVVIIFDKKSYFKYYFIIGWGSPLLLFAAYIPTMIYVVDLPPKTCWSYYKNSIYMLVLYIPLVVVLIVDFIVLVYTVSIFVRRQRGTKKGDFIKIRKAIKGTLILSPLLGVIYLLIFFVPLNAPIWYQYFLRIAYPMQGTLACLVYITFSGELLNQAKLKYKSSVRSTNVLENGYSWSFTSRSRNSERSTIRAKTGYSSPDQSIDPSGLSHSFPPCDNGSKCGCPDAAVLGGTGYISEDEEENSF